MKKLVMIFMFFISVFIFSAFASMEELNYGDEQATGIKAEVNNDSTGLYWLFVTCGGKRDSLLLGSVADDSSGGYIARPISTLHSWRSENNGSSDFYGKVIYRRNWILGSQMFVAGTRDSLLCMLYHYSYGKIFSTPLPVDGFFVQNYPSADDQRFISLAVRDRLGVKRLLIARKNFQHNCSSSPTTCSSKLTVEVWDESSEKIVVSHSLDLGLCDYMDCSVNTWAKIDSVKIEENDTEGLILQYQRTIFVTGLKDSITNFKVVWPVAASIKPAVRKTAALLKFSGQSIVYDIMGRRIISNRAVAGLNIVRLPNGMVVKSMNLDRLR
jgi:hypothetical protein